MKKNIIIFEAPNNHVFEVRERPEPATKFIPNWWKDIPKYSNNKKKIDLDPGATVTVKQCAPTIDMFSMGYIITLWADLLVTQTEHGPLVRWKTHQDVLDMWSQEQVDNFEIPEGYSRSVFKYLHGWRVLTKPGWSTMFVHPFAYQNLPIRAISGVVDTDILTTDINCPFVIKKDFEGVIEKGTPIAQIIPFKREEWSSKFTIASEEKTYLEIEKISTKIYGYYSSKRSRKIFK